jgi:hypothetical protein
VRKNVAAHSFCPGTCSDFTCGECRFKMLAAMFFSDGSITRISTLLVCSAIFCDCLDSPQKCSFALTLRKVIGCCD